MRPLSFPLAGAVVLAVSLVLWVHAGHSETNHIKVGKVIGGNGFHIPIPSYVAMHPGFYKAEGLDAQFVVLQGRPLVTAALSGNVDLVPISSRGAQAALSGAAITYTSASRSSRNGTLVVSKSITKIWKP